MSAAVTKRRKLQLAVAAGVILLARAATADPSPTPPHGTTGGGSTFDHIETPSTCRSDGGTDFRLPPGYFLDEPSWKRYDADVKQLQDDRTRLTAENASMKASLSSWQPGWWTLLGVAASAAAGGWYLRGKL